MFTRLANSLQELSETQASQGGVSSGLDGIDFAPNPSPSPSKAPSLRDTRSASTSSLNSVGRSQGGPSPDRPVWRRFVSRAGRFIQDMVDLDDEYDDEPGPEPGREQRWSPNKQREWERGTGVDDRGNYNDGGREPLGETTEPSSLYRQDGAPDGLHDDGVHYDRQPSEPSQLVSIDDMIAISSHTPVRHRHKKWVLLYSTLRDGISMQTLLRKAKGHAPTVLLVRDMSKHVFGAFCSESWRVSQRYFGTGETFVFRVGPDPAVWKWWLDKSNEQQNDFFLWGSPEGIAVGGAGGYAIWLDSQLCHGLSRCSATFGNSCLASAEEFPIGAVELWALE